MPLVSACKVSEIRSDIHKKRKQFIFKVIWPLEESEKEESKDGAMPADGEASAHSGINASGPNLLKPIKGASSSSAAKKKTAAKKREEGESKAMSSTKVAALAVGGVALGAVTAGVGLLAGLLVVGISAAAGGGAAAFTSDVKEYHLQLACDTYHEAEGWVFALENQIHALGGTAGHTAKSLIPYIGGLRHSSIQTSNAPPPEIRLGEVEDWVKSSKWRVSEVWEGLRIMEQVCISPDTSLNTDDTNELINDSLKASNSNKAILVPGVPPCMRVTMSINGSASDTFATIMNMPFKSRTGSIKSLRIVETIDYNSDIIHLVLQPSYVWPTWTSKCTFGTADD